MSHLINSGTYEDVAAAVKTCTSRKLIRLALHNERERSRSRKTVIALLLKKLSV